MTIHSLVAEAENESTVCTQTPILPTPVQTKSCTVIPTAINFQRKVPLPILPIKNRDIISLLPVESIVWIHAEGKYTIIATSEKRYVSNYSISELDNKINSPYFLRVHRSYIVNLRYIVELRKISSGRIKCVTKIQPDSDIIVSKNYFKNLKTRLMID